MLGNMLNDDRPLKEVETEIMNLRNVMNEKLTGQCFNIHSTRNNKKTFTSASHFLNLTENPRSESQEQIV